MTDTEIAIMIKNMARETVRRVAVKNAANFRETRDSFGQKVFSLEGTDIKIVKVEPRNPSERKHGLPFEVYRGGNLVNGFKSLEEAKSAAIKY